MAAVVPAAMNPDELRTVADVIEKMNNVLCDYVGTVTVNFPSGCQLIDCNGDCIGWIEWDGSDLVYLRDVPK